MDLQLTDRVILVGGASRGIGRAIAERVLAEGARVMVCGRDAQALQAAQSDMAARHPGKVLAFCGDLSESVSACKAVAAATESWGRLDDVVANMGTGAGKRGWDTDDDEWARLFNANLFASMRLARAAIPALSANPAGGSIVFIGSITGIEATPAPLAYSAAKAALLNYSKNLARLLAGQRIRVNAVVPGNILFDGGTWQKRQEDDPQQVRAMLDSEVPQQRFGKAHEIASMVAYLCSPSAGFATGSSFVMDGGQTRSL